MKTRTFFAISLVMILLVPHSVIADDDMAELKAQVDRLAQANLQLARENSDLKAQIASLKDRLAKTGADSSSTKTVDAKPNVDAKAPDAKSNQNQATAESTTTVAKALHAYMDAVGTIQNVDGTDIQKREKWLAAAKELEGVLSKNKVTITYTVRDVSFDQRGTKAVVTPDTAILKSNNPDIPDVTFRSFQIYTISASEQQANLITKDSTMTLDVALTLGVDTSKPASDQPAIIYAGRGFQEVGRIEGTMSIFIVGELPILTKSNPVLTIDGIKRKIVR